MQGEWAGPLYNGEAGEIQASPNVLGIIMHRYTIRPGMRCTLFLTDGARIECVGELPTTQVQHFGAGYMLFSEHLARKLAENPHSVYWPGVGEFASDHQLIQLMLNQQASAYFRTNSFGLKWVMVIPDSEFAPYAQEIQPELKKAG